MMARDTQNAQFTLIHPASERTTDQPDIGENRPTQARIRIRIPQKYHQEPVISRLISDYHLNVNVKAALLGANGQYDGWFDLEIQGTANQIQRAFSYLDKIEVEIWREAINPEEENW